MRGHCEGCPAICFSHRCVLTQTTPIPRTFGKSGLLDAEARIRFCRRCSSLGFLDRLLLVDGFDSRLQCVPAPKTAKNVGLTLREALGDRGRLCMAPGQVAVGVPTHHHSPLPVSRRTGRGPPLVVHLRGPGCGLRRTPTTDAGPRLSLHGPTTGQSPHWRTPQRSALFAAVDVEAPGWDVLPRP